MRRTVLLLVVLLLGAAVAFAGAKKEEAEAAAITEFDWRNFEGSTIRVLANRHPWTDAIEPLLSEFTALTGIEVNLEVYPEDQFRSKRSVELISGVAEIDVTMLMPMQGGPRWIAEEWAVPIDQFLNDPLLTSPEYDKEDFLGAALDSEMSTTYAPRGKKYLLGIPITVENQALMYRKDVFEEYDLSVPKTVEEMYETAKWVNENIPDMVGIVMRGKRAAATSQWSSMLYTMGGNWLDENGCPAINTPAAIAAFEMWGKLARDGSVGQEMVSYHWYETTTDFSQGRSAMHWGPCVFNSIYEDPEKSKIVGKVGYARIPEGPTGESIPYIGTWGLSIPYLSKNREAAWYFIQWATSQDIVKRLQLDHMILGGRKSAWEDPELENYLSKDLIESSMASLEVAKPFNPPVIQISEVRDIVGSVIVTAIQGGDVKAAADEANRLLAAAIGKTDECQ
jgi:multiple sugar transport system substrate-binding protein